MDNELYIDDEALVLGKDSVIALTLQVNDISNIESRDGNYTNNIKIPFNSDNDSKLGVTRVPQSSTNKPYSKLPIKFIDTGVELIPSGYGVIERTTKEYELTLYSGNSDFFSLIKGLKMIDIDFSDLDHVWTKAEMISANPNTDGYTYPIADYNDRIRIANITNKIFTDSLYPALFIHTIVERLVSHQGWTLEGDILTDERYINSVLAMSKNFENPDTFFRIINGIKSAYIDTTEIDTSLTNKMKYVVANVSSSAVGQWYGYNSLTALVAVNCSPLLEFIDKNDFSQNSWTSPQTTTVNILIDIKANYIGGNPVIGGATIAQPLLKVYNKTQGVFAGTGTLPSNPIVSSSISTVEYAVDVNANVNEGDELVFFLYNAAIPTFQIDLHFTKCDFTIRPQKVISEGNRIYMTYQTPDMSQSDFMKTIMNMFCIVPDGVSYNKVLKLRSFDELIDNLPIKRDWSKKFVENSFSTEFRKDNFYQTNDFTYKQDYNIPLLFGNGYFQIDDKTIDLRGNVVELPFGSSIESNQTCIQQDGVVRSIPEIDLSKSISPRVLIIRRENNSDGIIYHSSTTGDTTETVGIPFCHFVLANFKGLSFVELLNDYWKIFTGMTRQLKAITVSLYLTPVDVNNFDFFIPVYLEQFSADFYVNKISNYKKGFPTSVELIRINEPKPIEGTTTVDEEVILRIFESGNVHTWESGNYSQFEK